MVISMAQLMPLRQFQKKDHDWWANKSMGRRVQCPGCGQGCQMYVAVLPGSHCQVCNKALQVLGAPEGKAEGLLLGGNEAPEGTAKARKPRKGSPVPQKG